MRTNRAKLPGRMRIYCDAPLQLSGAPLRAPKLSQGKEETLFRGETVDQIPRATSFGARAAEENVFPLRIKNKVFARDARKQ